MAEGEIHELRALLMDCVALWGVDARIAIAGVDARIAIAGVDARIAIADVDARSAVAAMDGIEIGVSAGTFLVQRAPHDMRPVRWLLHTPDRRAADRPPRATPSIVALLSALRDALGAERGNKLRIGAST